MNILHSTAIAFAIIAVACASPEDTARALKSRESSPGEVAGQRVLRDAETVAAGHPALAAIVSGRASAFQRAEAGHFLSDDLRTSGSIGVPSSVAVRIPATGNLPVEITRHGTSHRLLLRLEGAVGVPSNLVDGRVVHAELYVATDSLWVADPGRVEQLLLLRDRSAPHEFTWQVSRSEGIVETRRDASGGLVFVDTNDRMVFRIPLPFAVDARGERRDARLEWNGDELGVDLDVTGLEYPILLDPTVEALWESPVITGSVPARRQHAMAFDRDRGVSVLFGGAGSAFLCDTWEFALGTGSGTWTPKSQPSPCPTLAGSLTARFLPSMAYDTAANRTLLFGGFLDTTFVPADDLWEWNGLAWSKCTEPSCTAGGPPARYAAGFAFDTTRGRAVLFGGFGSSAERCDTWEWRSDTRAWVNGQDPADCDAITATNPTRRQGVSMAFDEERNVTVLFGGMGPTSVNNEVWEWDGTGTWSQRCLSAPCTTNRPTPRQLASMAYDSVTKRVTLHGGTNEAQDTPYGDAWLWNGTVWTPLGTSGPEPRSQHAMVFDSTEKRTVLFGGFGAANLVDTWTLSTRGNDCNTGADCDTGICATDTSNQSVDTKVCCDEDCSGTCRACTAALKQSGTHDGVCGVAKEGTDPQGSCAASAPSSCGNNGFCNASGGCALWPSTTVCVSQSCSGSTRTPDRLCNGSGTCGAAAPAACPNNLACADGVNCRTACTLDSHCASGHFCNSVGACELKKTLGTQCPTSLCYQNGDCDRCNTAGGCVDGYCCQSTCTTACRNCGNASGQCQTVAGAVGTGTDDLPECTGNQTCSPAGDCLKKNGQTEGTGANCASGFSSDGVCCNVACAGPCNACSTAAGAAQNGTCANLAPGNAGVSNGCADTGYLCRAGGVCPTSCIGDSDCVSDRYCDASGHCALRKAQAAPCNAVSNCYMGSTCRECSSGFSCEDGVCCDTLDCDNGDCRACTAALKGSGVDGVCGSVAPGTDPRNRCPDPTDALSCGRDGFCNDSGACRPFAPSNKSCGPTICTTNGSSVQGQLCSGEGACDGGAEQSCAPFKCITNGSSGACATTCSRDTDCAAGAYCTTGAMRVCRAKQALGTECGGNNECNSNYCVDGHCCGDSCDTACRSCANSSGTCTTVVRNDEDDHCDGLQICDADGACKLKQTSDGCSDGDECVTGYCVDGHCCEDSCGTPCRSCDNSRGTCSTVVTDDDDDTCDGNDTCDPDGTCKKKAGQQCNDGDECASAICVDAVCCDSACDGACEACDVEDAEGTCTLVEGEPHGARAPCAGESGSVCSGSCDGTDVDCAYPGRSERCGSACSDGRVVTQSCDGAGACIDEAPVTCGLYACDDAAGACRTTCTENAHCAAGSACGESGSCVAVGASCQDGATLRDADGNSIDCSPFRCSVDRCLEACESIDDCAGSTVCDSSGRCVSRNAAAPDADEDSGCGCRQAPRPTDGGRAVFALGALGLFLARRRTRRSLALSRAT